MLPQKRQSLTNGCCGSVAQRTVPSPWRRWEIAAGAFSLGVWVLMPKCPICLAAYATLGTGLVLSFAAATYLRWSLLGLSGALLCYLMLKRRVRASTGM